MFGDKEFDGVGYPTPSSIPIDFGYRTAKIPADTAWYGIFMGLLETLIDEKNWQQFEGGITREEAAAVWLEIIEGLYVSAIEGPCCPEFQTDPATGLPEVSYDGGLTWTKFPDGDYNDGEIVPYANKPPALNKGSDVADICFAAWNAAAVIAQFYQQTVGQVAADLFNAVLSVNMFLAQLNSFLLRLVYPQEAQVLQAIEFYDFDWGSYATAPTLDEDQQNALVCLLVTSATVTDGVVSFDFTSVTDGVIGALGINPGTAVLLLLNYMADSGLNYAGGVQSNTTADCDVCGWSQTFDFTVALEPFVTGPGDWEEGVGINGIEAGTFSKCAAYARVDFEASFVTNVSWVYNLGGGSGDNYSRLIITKLAGETVVEDNQAPGTSGSGVTMSLAINETVDSVLIGFNSGTAAVEGQILSCTISGSGDNPFA